MYVCIYLYKSILLAEAFLLFVLYLDHYCYFLFLVKLLIAACRFDWFVRRFAVYGSYVLTP